MIKKEIESLYENLFYLSKEKHYEYIEYLPNGCARCLSYFEPFPLHVERGEGAYVYSIEGHKLLDLTNGYSALIHGHTNQDINRETIHSLSKGTLFSTPSEILFRFTKKLNERIPSMEKMLICNSGTEATLFALRTARAIKRKNKILKIRGGYHGLHDCVAVSPENQNIELGITEGMVKDVIEVDFNDFESFEKAISENNSDLAGVIIEPFLGAGGIIPPKKGYLEFVRAVTEREGVILIFDEILSFRLHKGGAQGYHNIYPDLTTLGKVIGGGFPIGVFGGKAKIMNIYDKRLTQNPIYLSGTFNGYETAMYAGYEALRLYDAKEINRLNSFGDNLYHKIRGIILRLNLLIKITQCGSILQIHFVNEEINSYKVVLKTDKALLHLFHLLLLSKKYYITPRGMIVLSTPMEEKEIDGFAQAVEESLLKLIPLIRDRFPHLIKDTC